MNRILTVTLATLTGVLCALPPSPAEAQCQGDEWFCADVSIGASVTIGTPAPPPPRQSQVVVVQPAPPPPPPPPPRVVVVQPAPLPPPQTTVVVTTTRPAPTPVTIVEPVPQPRPSPEPAGFGLHGQVGGMMTDRVMVGGLSGAFRIRPNMGHFALDLGIGVYGGRDYNDLDRLEIPVTADALFYFNPRSRFQVYGVAGVGASFARAEGVQDGAFFEREYAYLGGQAGIGAELRLSRWFAINADVRGFVRHRVDDNPEPEFHEIDDDGSVLTTDTSGGGLFNFGATVYF